jgi:hypothetical protein
MLMSFAAVVPGLTSPPLLRLPAKALAAEHYTYVAKVGDLPKDVREGIARQLKQDQLLMADAGAPFNSTDVVIDRTLPGHRLILAAVGPTYSVVHFERGGVALMRWVIVFEKSNAGLSVLWHGSINHTYGEPKQLETAIRTGALWKAPTNPAR